MVFRVALNEKDQSKRFSIFANIQNAKIYGILQWNLVGLYVKYTSKLLCRCLEELSIGDWKLIPLNRRLARNFIIESHFNVWRDFEPSFFDFSNVIQIFSTFFILLPKTLQSTGIHFNSIQIEFYGWTKTFVLFVR